MKVAVPLICAALLGCSPRCPRYWRGDLNPEFNSPREAIACLSVAARAEDRTALVRIFGSGSQALIDSGDEVGDKYALGRFNRLFRQAHQLAKLGDGKYLLEIGEDNRPFPMPLVKQAGKWSFDTAAGFDEIINRRIGANESKAVAAARAFVDAQLLYFHSDPNGDGVKEYAQRFLSSPGKKDGLYWPVKEGEEASPLGNLAAQAGAEGYTKKDTGPTPYHGYYFRILTRQGSNAPGGRKNYLVKGRLTGGFALVAFPVQWNNSGVMTFLVNQDGKLYQRDLGRDTGVIASTMQEYDPEPSWFTVD